MENTSVFKQLISPYEKYYDEQNKRNYYYNTEQKESVWELPEEILKKIQQFRELYDKERFFQNNQQEEEEVESDQKNIEQFISPEIIEKLQKKQVRNLQLMERPSRKQLEQSLADKFAYKEGDQEYNIWYGRHLSDTKNHVRDHKQPAVTRCDSELDTGYTKADINDKYSAYFCHHWAKGCCSDGVGCRYFHRVPSLTECMAIDNSRDIFGRARHSSHREDRGGIGSFMNDTKSLEVNDFKCPQDGVGVVAQMYEILYRHFNEWGDVDDIKYVHGQNKALVRYQHRCMAEFAKEAMQHQALDQREVINIKWFLENKDEENKNKYDKEQSNILKQAVEKRNNEQSSKQRMKLINEKRIEHVQCNEVNYDENKQNNCNNEILERIEKMNKILESIDQANSGSSQQKPESVNYVRPEINNLPLCFKKKQ